MRMMISAAAAAALLLAASAEAAPVNLPAWQSTVKYSTTSTGASGFGNYARATSKVVYDAAAGTYRRARHRQPDDDRDLRPVQPGSSADANFTTYGTATNSFRRLNQSPSNTLIVLTYVDYGQWRRTATASGDDERQRHLSGVGIARRRRRASRAPAARSTARSSTARSSTRTAPMPSAGAGSSDARISPAATITYSATATGTKEVGSRLDQFRHDDRHRLDLGSAAAASRAAEQPTPRAIRWT